MDLSERPLGPIAIRHPWEQARRRLIAGVLRSAATGRGRPPITALDIGSGDAWLAGALARDLELRSVDAFDVGYTDEDCRALQTDVVHPTATCPDGRHDLVLLLDVIEHVADDVDLLRTARERVADDGVVMVTVPAWPRLATNHDTALGHYRRYTPSRLRAALADAGLEESRLGGAFISLLPVRAGQRVLERVRGPRPLPDLGQWGRGPLATRALTTALAWDAAVGSQLAARGAVLPGLTLWATAVRAS